MHALLCIHIGVPAVQAEAPHALQQGRGAQGPGGHHQRLSGKVRLDKFSLFNWIQVIFFVFQVGRRLSPVRVPPDVRGLRRRGRRQEGLRGHTRTRAERGEVFI